MGDLPALRKRLSSGAESSSLRRQLPILSALRPESLPRPATTGDVLGFDRALRQQMLEDVTTIPRIQPPRLSGQISESHPLPGSLLQLPEDVIAVSVKVGL